MGFALRVLFGVVLGWGAIWLGIHLYGLLAVWSPWPNTWWAHHPRFVLISSAFLAALPLVIVLGLVFSRLFRHRALLGAAVAMTISLAVAVSDALTDPKDIGATLGSTWQIFAPFLVGPPVIALLLTRRRSNNRWSGP